MAISDDSRHQSAFQYSESGNRHFGKNQPMSPLSEASFCPRVKYVKSPIHQHFENVHIQNTQGAKNSIITQSQMGCICSSYYLTIEIALDLQQKVNPSEFFFLPLCLHHTLALGGEMLVTQIKP